MTVNIPENLRKYCSLAEGEDIIDRFVCPIEGCDFTTRLGPGAIRMHMLMKADPMTAVYEPSHDEYFRVHAEDLTLDSVKELAKIPYRAVSYRKP
jgi:hypothetical protein